MKKIFLVTWFKSENYGTCLQAYATYRFLTTNNYDICFLGKRKYYSISRMDLYIKKAIEKLKTKVLVKKQLDFGDYLIRHNEKIEKINSFADLNYCVKDINSLNDIISIDNEFDYYLIGGDQMWNPLLIRPQYLLDFVPTKSSKPRYSYATSFGVDNVPNSKKRIYQKLLKNFSKITVREPRAVELVKKLSGKNASIVLDPTFLLNQNDWRSYSENSNILEEYGINKKDYVLCYFIGNADFNHLQSVFNVAKKMNKKVVVIPIKESDYHLDKNKFVTVANACPYDFVSLIDNSSLVCTDSFHAVVFSFLMNTAFYSFPRFKKGDKYSQESRIKNIIDKFCLTNSYWKENLNYETIKKHLSTSYDKGYEILSIESNKSKQCLLEMLGGEYVNGSE